MKIILSLFLFLCLSISIQAQEQSKEWTLQECLQYALDNNISIEQSELDLKAAEIDKSDALGNYLPTLNGQASNTWNTGLTQNITTGVLQQQTTRNLSMNVTAGVTVFNGLRNLREWQRAKLSRLASKYSLEQMKDNIILNVANAYLNILVNKEQARVLQEQNQVTKKQLNRTQELIDAGSKPRGDLLEIKATDANEQQQIITAKNNKKIALINLAQILQIDDYENFRIAETTYDVPLNTIMSKSPNEIIAQAKENRYEIKIAQKNVDLAEKDVQIAKSGFYPSLDAFINYNTRESGAGRILQGGIDPDEPSQVIGQVESSGEPVIAPNFALREGSPRSFFDQLSRNDGVSYGLRINIPILNGFSTRNSVRRREIDVERNENALKQAKLDLESNVYQAYVDAQGAAKAYQAAQVSVQSQQSAYNYSQDRYDVGMINAFDFSQSKFRLANAKSQLVNAKYDYIFKLKVLELYFGVKPEDIKL